MTQEIIPGANYTIGHDSACKNTSVNGYYQGLLRLTSAEFVTINAHVKAPGSYAITTGIVNGYQFSSGGIFSDTGHHIVRLNARGLPLIGQIDLFTVTTEGGGSCNFRVIVFPWICNRAFTDVRDSQNYRTVLMNRQCWMAQNLNIGRQISSLRNQTDNHETEKYCYNGNEGNCRTFGGLYQWDELMQYTTSPGTRGLCPIGWHIPTDEEWCKLTSFLDPAVDCSGIGIIGTNLGAQLKEAGTKHWASPNSGATNSIEFSGLPGGYRDYPGSFSNLPYEAYFWTSTECGENHAWNRGLHYYDSDITRDDFTKSNGFSARCVLD